MNEKTCKNCIYRENYTCTKLSEEVGVFVDVKKVARKIVECLQEWEVDMGNVSDAEWQDTIEIALENEVIYSEDTHHKVELSDLDNDFVCKHWR